LEELVKTAYDMDIGWFQLTSILLRIAYENNLYLICKQFDFILSSVTEITYTYALIG
jgi:hypothetical protein